MEGIQCDYEMDSRDPKIAWGHYWSWDSVPHGIHNIFVVAILWWFGPAQNGRRRHHRLRSRDPSFGHFIYIHHLPHEKYCAGTPWHHLSKQVRHNEIEFYVIEFIMSTEFGIVESINCTQNCSLNMYEFDENSNCPFQLMLDSVEPKKTMRRNRKVCWKKLTLVQRMPFQPHKWCDRAQWC